MKAGTLEIELLTNVLKLQDDMERIKRSVSGMETSVSKSVSAANDNIAGMGKGAKLAGHQIQNLTYQLNDVAVSLASGQAPMTVFMQQGTQIAQIMAQAGVGIGGVVTQLGGLVGGFLMAHPVLAAVGVAAGVAAGAIGFITSEINKNAEVQVTWKDTVLGAWDLAKNYLTGQLSEAFKYFGTTSEEVWAWVTDAAKTAINFLIGVGSLAPRAIIAAFQTMPAAIADVFYSAVNFGIRGINGLIERAVSGINSFISMVNPLLEKAGLSIGKLGTPQVAELQNNYAGAARAAVSTFAKVATDTWQRDYIGDFAGALSGAAQNRAKIREAAEKAGKDAGKAGGAAAGRAMANEAADKFAEDFAKFAEAGMNGFLKNFASMQKTWASNDNEELRSVQEEMARAQKERTQGAIDEAEARAAINEQLRMTVNMLDQIGGAGKVMADFGAFLYGARTGDFGGVRGTAGFLAQSLLTTTVKGDNGTLKRGLNELGQQFSDALDDVFGANGSFLKILQNAGVGAAIGGMVFGQGNKGATTGASIGGAFGEAAFKSITPKLFSSLGSFAGPLGTIAGSLIGGLVGGLFKSTKYGAASITNGKIVSTQNSSEYGSATNSAASGIAGALSNIASQLGGTVGNYAVSIGLTNGNWNVNPGTVKGKIGTDWQKDTIDFKKDQEGAIRWAIANAIADGAIQGVREGTQRLLKTGGDLEQALAKALKFEGVFRELKAATDPVGASLDALTKQFNELRAIFDEAGASAAEYAQLEQLLAIKRKEITDDDERKKLEKLNDRRSLEVQLLEAQGKVQEALALQREIELSQTEEGLRGLMRQIYAARDLAAANEKIAVSANETITRFSQLADSLRSYRDSLTGEGGGALTRNQALVRLMSTGGLAAAGNADAMGQLQGVSEAFLDVSRKNAGSAIQYRRDVAISAGYIDKAIRAADGQVSSAQAQIEALRSIDTSASETAAAMAADGVVGFAAVESVKVNNSLLDEIKALREETAALREEVATSRRDDERYSLRMIELNSSMERIWKRAEIEGLPIQNDPTNPITVVSA